VLGLVCLPALPVGIITAAVLRARPRLRPWLVAVVAGVVMAGVLAAFRAPIFGGNLLTFPPIELGAVLDHPPAG
jgi:hypothetical protein